MTDAERIKNLEDQVRNLTLAFEQQNSFYTKHFLWLKETGVLEAITKYILALIPPSQGGTTDVLGVLRAAGVFLTGGKMGLGGEPVQDTDALLTVYGGQILGKNKGNWQNPGADIENVLDIANSDGGGRFLQYCRFFMGKMIRSPATRPKNPDNPAEGYEPNPPMIRAFADSHGEQCMSMDPQTPEQKASVRLAADGRLYGQLYYERIDWGRKKIILTAFQPGWTVEVAGSNAYGDSGIKQL